MDSLSFRIKLLIDKHPFLFLRKELQQLLPGKTPKLYKNEIGHKISQRRSFFLKYLIKEGLLKEHDRAKEGWSKWVAPCILIYDPPPYESSWLAISPSPSER